MDSISEADTVDPATEAIEVDVDLVDGHDGKELTATNPHARAERFRLVCPLSDEAGNT
jgi:hypothetical protein